MKRLVVMLCVLGAASLAHAGFDLTGWNWQRPVDIQNFSGFVRLSIPPEVFNESQPSLNDLRVLDENSSLVPHVIHWGRFQEVRQLEWRSARLMNATFIPGKYSRVIIDMGEGAEKNFIKLALSGKNYGHRALLEGSNDIKSWEVVAEDLWLFDVTVEGQNYKVDSLRFPVNNFRYLRLTVYNMADDPRHVAVETVQVAFQQIETEKELVSAPVRQMLVSHDKDKKQSIIEFDLGFRNLPVISFQFEVTTPYFYRGCELQGRNEVKEKVTRKTERGSDLVEREAPWRFVHRGVLYRTQYKNKKKESLTLEGINAPYRYMRFRVFNGDNPPLQINGLSVLRRETSLVFQAQTRKRYLLIGGNPNAYAADYDLAKSIEGLDSMKLQVVSLGSPTLIVQKEKRPPWTERYSVVIWIVLLVAVGVMVGFIIKNLKKLPAPKE
jgi:hypothetical protein